MSNETEGPQTDPFGISKGVPKPNTGFDRAQKISGAIKRGARGVSNAAHNKTDRKAGQMFRGKEPVDDHGRAMPGTKYEGYTGRWGRLPNGKKIGDRPPRQKKLKDSALGNFGIGAAAGATAGSLAGDARHGGQIRQDSRQYRKVNKAFKAPKMPKRTHLITSAGTKQGKPKWGDREGLRPGYLAAGAASGGALAYTSYSAERKDARRRLNSTYRKQGKQKIAKAGTLERYTTTRKDRMKMRGKDAANVGAQTTASVLGATTAVKYAVGYRGKRVAPGKKALIAAGAAGAATAAGAMAGKYDKKQYRVKKNGSAVMAKKDNKTPGGRLAAGAAFGGWHGAVAGKKGRKLRAAGNQVAGTALGSVAGSTAASVLTRGKSIPAMQAGSLGGAMVGAGAGTARAHKKGHFKPIKKNDSISAFGVDHGY